MTDLEYVNSLPDLTGKRNHELLDIGAELKRRVEAKGQEYARIAGVDPASVDALTPEELQPVIDWLKTHTEYRDVRIYFDEDGRSVSMRTGIWIAPGLTGKAEHMAIQDEVSGIWGDYDEVDYVPTKEKSA